MWILDLADMIALRSELSPKSIGLGDGVGVHVINSRIVFVVKTDFITFVVIFNICHHLVLVRCLVAKP